jgi:hypothetical protein
LHRGFRRDAWILFLDYGRLMGDPELSRSPDCASLHPGYGL